MERLYGRQSRFTIRSFAHYFQAGILLDTEPQSLPHQRMVICNQNSNLLIHDPGPPSQTTTNVPRPAQPPVYKRNHDCCSVRPSGQPNHPPSKRRRPFVIPSVPGFPTSPLSLATTYVVLPKENHMQSTEAATLDRKSGEAEGSAVRPSALPNSSWDTHDSVASLLIVTLGPNRSKLS